MEESDVRTDAEIAADAQVAETQKLAAEREENIAEQIEIAQGTQAQINAIAAAQMKATSNIADGSTITLGRIVHYRSRTGNYSVPAIVNCTTDSIYQPGVEAGFVPAIDRIDKVHLTVFSPGRAGMRVDQENTPGAEAFVVTSPYPISENVSGCYQEWNIPYDSDGGPGTWMWPPKV